MQLQPGTSRALIVFHYKLRVVKVRKYTDFVDLFKKVGSIHDISYYPLITLQNCDYDRFPARTGLNNSLVVGTCEDWTEWQFLRMLPMLQ